MPSLPLRIAWRYLFAKKSHNVINIISAISVAGMAIGTAALIAILSVYNGFDSIVKSSLGQLSPDITVSPSKGKYFVPEGDGFDWAYTQDDILNMCGVLEENVYLTYSGKNAVVKAKGVDSVFEEETPIAGNMAEGTFSLHKGSVPLGVVSAPLAYSMGISPRFLGAIELYFPASDRPFSVSDPAASLESIKVYPSGIYSLAASSGDSRTVILPIEQMRSLLHLDDEVSSVEIRLRDGVPASRERKIIQGLSERLGPGFKVKDRTMQNASLYKMMRYEKASVYLILLFVTVIIGFNIFSSLSMLIIEKEEDIKTFFAMGAGEKTVRRIFVLEGWLISLLGMAAGLVLGIIAVLVQQKFGIVKMPGSFALTKYPVILEPSDVILTAVTVAAVGYLISLLPSVSRRR